MTTVTPPAIVYVGIASASGAPNAHAVYHRLPQCARKQNGPPRIRTWLGDALRAGMRECSRCW